MTQRICKIRFGPFADAGCLIWRDIRGNLAGIARQPEAQGRLFTPFFITVGLVEAAYFINLAFMALFVFATPGAS